MRTEEFPRFWTSIGEVRQLDEKRYFLRGTHDGRDYEMEAELILRIPARRIAWRTKAGPASSGVICFDPQPGGKTCVTLKVLYEPDGGWQQPAAVADRIGLALARFKALLEHAA